MHGRSRMAIATVVVAAMISAQIMRKLRHTPDFVRRGGGSGNRASRLPLAAALFAAQIM